VRKRKVEGISIELLLSPALHHHIKNHRPGMPYCDEKLRVCLLTKGHPGLCVSAAFTMLMGMFIERHNRNVFAELRMRIGVDRGSGGN